MIISSNPGLQWAQSYLNRLAALASPPTISATQRNAVCKLLSDIGATIDMSKFKAIYPFLGGTDTAHALNAISSSFKITWNGGITHNSSGVKGNGTTGYGDIGGTPSQLFNGQNSAHISLYLNDPVVTGFPFGVSKGSSGETSLKFNTSTTQISVGLNSGWTNFQHSMSPFPTGLWALSRGNPDHTLYKDGAYVIHDDTIPNSANPISDRNLYILASNGWNGTAFAVDGYFSTRCAFASIGHDLTADDHSNLYKAVQAYQTALGRQV